MKLSHIVLLTGFAMILYPSERWGDAAFLITFWIICTLLEEKIDNTNEDYSS